MQNLKRYTMLVAVALLAACGGDDDKDPAGPGNGETVGSFTATLAGDVAGSFSGEAAHASVAQGEEQGFVLALEDAPGNGAATAALLFARVNPAVPGVGQHGVMSDENGSEDDFAVIGVVTDANGTDWLCYGASGSINVTSSSAARVRGNFTIAGGCISESSETEQAVTLTGTFDSRSGTVGAAVSSVLMRAN